MDGSQKPKETWHLALTGEKKDITTAVLVVSVTVGHLVTGQEWIEEDTLLLCIEWPSQSMVTLVVTDVESALGEKIKISSRRDEQCQMHEI